ncbi:MAG TPA: hypothetical protein VF752_09650 [Thermoleophilaceae bacterium]
MSEQAENSENGRHLPVLAEPAEARPIERPAEQEQLPVVLGMPAPLAAATGGFLAGVATFLLVRVLRGGRRASLPARRSRRRGRSIEIAGTRSFLVDVHLIKR